MYQRSAKIISIQEPAVELFFTVLFLFNGRVTFLKIATTKTMEISSP